MQRGLRAMSAIAALIAAVVLDASPALAAPAPRSDQWWLSSWGVDKIWPITEGSGVTIGLLDTGVNAALPDLAGHVVPGGDTTGHGGDGRVDIDTQAAGHGTSMATLIVGQGRGTGMVGVAPKAKLLPVTVSDGIGTAQGFREHVAAGIRFAVDHGASVISISQAFPADAWPELCPSDILDAVIYASRHDTVIAAATGNNGGIGNSAEAPASCPGVLAVGGVNADTSPWGRTQQVSYVDVAGPASAIGVVDKSGRYSPGGSGTSSATALVAGGIALVRAAHPKMPARQIVQRAMATALDSGPPGFDNQTGYGAFRIHRVMDLSFQVPDSAPNPPYERLDKVLRPTGAAVATTTSTSTSAPRSAQPVVQHRKASSRLPMIGVGAAIAALLIAIGLVCVIRRRVTRTGGKTGSS